ncbi:PAS domain S-box protein [Natronomonas salina]|uniref:sensor histidine kinase n=1 Tax=Natronomonas salina TaxID=1710540 RepID=UPI0015B5F687|nr:ATP-binding protein [Natronomonas salina]QLD89557.1 PAS domain S-box protein [Natronomonas salina]
MRNVGGSLTALNGRRLLFALGGLYLALAAGWPLLVPGNPPLANIEVVGIIVGGSGLGLLVAAYWLPRSDIHPDSFPTILRWCLGAIGAMFAILLLVAGIAGLTNVIENILILTSLASLAGLGIGFQNAKAYTRALNAEERRREAERYSRELERYETIVETVHDGIFVADHNDTFTLVNDAYTELVGYDRQTLLGSNVSLVVSGDIETLAAEFEAETQANPEKAGTFEATLETASGERIETEATVARLPQQAGEGPDYVVVVRDVTTRNERKRALEQANERLKSSNERLEHFAYAASHDLKEPLRMVSSYLRLVQRRADDELSDETREYLEYAVDGADRMGAMIDGLLQYSRVETRGNAFEPVDLNDVVADVRSDLDVRISESDAAITVEELPTVAGDEHQLRQVFQNLITNAIVYSGDDRPRISIDTERSGDMWTVSVRDHGIGIEPEYQDKIFEVFQRLHAESEYSGSGIGLALCERIIERHGGTINVDSEPGEGATFSFSLPAVSQVASKSGAGDLSDDG